jgi:hypothetical protein
VVFINHQERASSHRRSTGGSGLIFLIAPLLWRRLVSLSTLETDNFNCF